MLTQIIFILIAVVILSRLGRFFLTPFFKKIGVMKYYSSMFCAIKIGEDIYEFHLGTSWDFFIQGNVTPKKTLYFLAKGLLNLCNDIELGKINRAAKFRGNTFYLKESTVSRFGFKARKLNIFEKLLFYQSYFELCVLNSIIHKRVTIIRVNNVRIIYSTGEEILKHRSKFEMILRRFDNPTFTMKGCPNTASQTAEVNLN